MNLTLATKVLDAAIAGNICYCTDLADSLTPDEPNFNLPNRLTNVMLKMVSEDTLIFIFVLKLLDKSKPKKRKKL